MPATVVTADTFADHLTGPAPVLVDFAASWCGPCKMLAPVIDEVADARDDVTVLTIDVDGAAELARTHRVMSVPTLVLFVGGREVGRTVGAVGRAGIDQLIDRR